MERRVRGNSHARCEVGEKLEITSKTYLSPFAATRARNQLFFSVLQHRNGKKAYPSRFLYI